MSNISWSDSLTTTLKQKPDQRVVIVGIGHELRGDDAAGLVVARALKHDLADQPHILVIEGGSAPENYTGVIRRFTPDLVLLIDAAEMAEPAGSIRWLAWEQTAGLSASTHTLPPYVLARYLHAEFGCELALIGIQPEQLTVGEGLSSVVQAEVDHLVAILTECLKSSTCYVPERRTNLG